PGDCDAEAGDDLLGASGGDAPVVSTILSGACPAFAEVLGDGRGGPTNLADEVTVVMSDEGNGGLEGTNQLEGNFESDECHGEAPFGWGFRPTRAQVACQTRSLTARLARDVRHQGANPQPEGAGGWRGADRVPAFPRSG